MNHNRERGAVIFVLVAVLAIAFLGFSLYALSHAFKSVTTQLDAPGVPAASKSDAAFAELWSVRLQPPLVHEMATVPGRRGEFFALNHEEVHRFDSAGARLAKFAAPDNASRLATDPAGRIPHVLITSSSRKWTGAIDFKETTGWFLHAFDTAGREVWTKRFDPKDVSIPEPMVASLAGTPRIVLGASNRILCFDSRGTQLWNSAIPHHPWTVSTDGFEGLLAARSGMKEIVRIDANGEVLGPWGKGDGPRRFRAIATPEGPAGISVRQVFGTGPGVRQAVAFYDGGGRVIRETQLPPDAGLMTYAAIASMNVDGSGRRAWVVGLGDGTLLVYSTDGSELARHTTGWRLRSVFAVPQTSGPDIVVTSTHSGLTAWRPVAGRLR